MFCTLIRLLFFVANKFCFPIMDFVLLFIISLPPSSYDFKSSCVFISSITNFDLIIIIKINFLLIVQQNISCLVIDREKFLMLVNVMPKIIGQN